MLRFVLVVVLALVFSAAASAVPPAPIDEGSYGTTCAWYEFDRIVCSPWWHPWPDCWWEGWWHWRYPDGSWGGDCVSR